MSVEAEVTELKGVGQKTAQLLQKLGIRTVSDIVGHYPRSYDIFALPTDIAQLREGETGAVECVVGTRVEQVRTGRYLIQSLRVNDPTGSVRLVWYNSPFTVKQLKAGSRFIFRGRVIRKRNELCIAQPVIYSREAYLRRLKELQPVYPLTKGITNNMFSKMVREALTLCGHDDDFLKAGDRARLGLMSERDALQTIHFPVSKEACIEAHKRIVFDEFAVFAASVKLLKSSRNTAPNAYVCDDFSACEELISKLPYELTGAQLKVFEEIKADLSGDTIMSRMIQGDVGSGKTIVAILAILACVGKGYQGCIMAPTDVLARQHYEGFRELLEPMGVRVTLLTGQMSAAAKREAYGSIANHETDVIVGTHALIQDSVIYDRLAIAVIDEQHRFGVGQREAIGNKGISPHILAMSATPIPRSLAIILYGDLDLSIINEMPRNRLPIKNCVVGTGYRPTAYNFILKQIAEGHQAYIICPMVEESEAIEGENVTDYTEELRRTLGDGIRVGLLHGRMKAAEKNSVMDEFSKGNIDILVSTTVIEVGVNVPNATVMMVENAERFGLAQLHQLRGRVGRGKAQSYCIFIKGTDNADVDERLDILVKYNNGMDVAEQDLKLRGPGDFFGTRQSGDPAFKLADIYGDADMLKLATDYVNGLDEKELLWFSRTQKDNWII